jgi:hypothetical protein
MSLISKHFLYLMIELSEISYSDDSEDVTEQLWRVAVRELLCLTTL